MSRIRIQYHKISIGELLIGAYEGKLCLMDYRYRRMRTTVDRRIKKYFDSEYVEANDPVIDSAKQQITEYLDGTRTEFDIPLAFAGSSFQIQVWEALLRIPYGETRTYTQLAEEIGDAKAVRAVASANGANAMSVFVPCHRIVESSGGLAGYAGGLSVKRKLLNLEAGQAQQMHFL